MMDHTDWTTQRYPIGILHLKGLNSNTQSKINPCRLSHLTEMGNVDTLIETGRNLARQMQEQNPELMETIRQQMQGGGAPGDGSNPPGNDQNPPPGTA